VASKKKPQQKTWRPTLEDVKLIADLKRKMGVTEVALIRMGLRKLAEREGLL
jgi:hypothetical protein